MVITNVTPTMKPPSRSTSKSLLSRLRGGRGATLIELMLAVGILGIVTPAILGLFTTVMQGFKADDAQNQLKKVNQETLLRFYMTLDRNKRIFDRATDAVSMVGRLDMTGCPAVTVTGGDNLFPTINIAGSHDPSNAAFVASEWGNMLLMLTAEGRVTCYPVTASLSVVKTIQIDTYRFYFYYLDRNPSLPNGLTGKKGSRLVEWRSELLADQGQLDSYISSDATLGANIVKFLRSDLASPAKPTIPVTLAVNYSATNPISMIYDMNNSGAIAMSTTRKVVKEWAPSTEQKTNGFTYLTRIPGSTFGGNIYRFGVAPNTNQWNESIQKIPLFAVGSGNFPSGFEVGIIGTAGARQVHIRQALVTEGDFGARRRVIGAEQSSTFTCKDIH
jgi:type II secretory pathway pseudopilin PulG